MGKHREALLEEEQSTGFHSVCVETFSDAQITVIFIGLVKLRYIQILLHWVAGIQ